MDPAQEYALKVMVDEDKDIVKFVFERNGGKIIRGLKSLLVTQSPAFKAMFKKEWYKGAIHMKDDVSFDEADIFSRFILLVSKVLKVSQLSVHVACACYFYAEKYQVTDLKSDILKQIITTRKRFTIKDITECLDIARLYELNFFKVHLYRVKLALSDENVTNFYQICSENGMDGLVKQVVTFLCHKPLNKSWPFDLINLVIEEERKKQKAHVNNLTKELSQLKETSRWSSQFEDFPLFN